MMNLNITEALAIVASANLSAETMLKIGASMPPKELLEEAHRVIDAEAKRTEKFHAQFGDIWPAA